MKPEAGIRHKSRWPGGPRFVTDMGGGKQPRGTEPFTGGSALSPGGWCQNWVKVQDTQLASPENKRIVVWTPHTFGVRAL